MRGRLAPAMKAMATKAMATKAMATKAMATKAMAVKAMAVRALVAVAMAAAVLFPGIGTTAAAAPTPPAPAARSAQTTSQQTGSGSSTAATDVRSVAASLRLDPLYVSTAPGTPQVSAGDVRGALPADVFIAVLPTSAAKQVGGEPAALPGALLGELQRPGTVLALVGSDIYGASRTQRADRVQEVLTDSRQRLQSSGGPTDALVIAARDLTGAGQLSDAPSATRAGSPNGSGFLYVVLALVAAALLAVPVLLRRARRPRAPQSPQMLRNRVEVDAYGRIVRRVSAEELADEQERGRGRPPGDRPPP